MHRMEFSMFVAHGANLYIGSSTWREMHVLCTCSSDKHSDGMIDMATCLHLLFFSWEKGRENVGEKWIDVTYKWRLVIGFSKEWIWGWGWITLVCCCCHRESGEHVSNVILYNNSKLSVFNLFHLVISSVLTNDRIKIYNGISRVNCPLTRQHSWFYVRRGWIMTLLIQYAVFNTIVIIARLWFDVNISITSQCDMHTIEWHNKILKVIKKDSDIMM